MKVLAVLLAVAFVGQISAKSIGEKAVPSKFHCDFIGLSIKGARRLSDHKELIKKTEEKTRRTSFRIEL